MVMKQVIFLLITLILLNGILRADDIAFQILKQQCYLGEEISFAIVVESEGQINEDFSKIILDEKEIPFKKNTSSNQSMSIINGKMYTKQSVRNTYVFSIVTTIEGQYTLPSMVFAINGKNYKTDSFNYSVTTMPYDSYFTFLVNIKNKRDFYYPSELIEMEIVFGLNTYTKFVNQVPMINGFDFIENPGLKFIGDQHSSHRIMINGREYPVQLGSNSTTMNTSNFNSFMTIPLVFRAYLPGSYKLDNCTARAQVATGRYSKERDFWGQRQAEVINIFSKAQPIRFEIKALPESNKPADYNGALGSFDVEVIASKDTEFKVGDPIILHVVISGKGDWESVRAPTLNNIPEISDFFRISNETPAGQVSEDSTKKEFDIKLRVKSATVKEIPAIPFSYFDVIKGQYVTKHSKPISIKVYENLNKVEVVAFDNKKESHAKDAKQEEIKPLENTAKKVSPLEPIAIMTVFDDSLLHNNQSATDLFLYLSFVPILLTLILIGLRYLLVSKIVSKLKSESKLKNSHKKCLQQLTALQGRLSEGDVVFRLLTEILNEFFELNFNFKMNSLSQEFVTTLIQNNRIHEDVGRDLLKLLEDFNTMKYSQTSFDREETRVLIENIKQVIARC